jgi:pilus assembly protein CpaF
MSDAPTDRNLRSLPIFGSADPSAVPGLGADSRPRGPGSHLLAAAGGNHSHTSRFAASALTADSKPKTTDGPDWKLIAALRTEVSNLLTTSLELNPYQTEDARKELARAHIGEVIQAHVERMVTTAGDTSAWTPENRQAMAKAVLDSLFGLGRIQPLVDEEGVENIDIYGYDNVFVNYSDGSFVRKPPIAASDDELLAELQFLAARGGENGRPFSATNPILDMDLPGGARLAAVHPPISPRPKAVIRIHRFVNITLDTLVKEQGTLTAPMAALLSTVVRAGRSVVVSGHPAAGKTTLVRALCSSINPSEPIVTIEKERELHLDRMGDRHLIVTALQYRPGQGERAADGSMPGEVTMVQLLEEALRLNTQRIVVGEVRGGEIDAMFQAMQAGVGSLSTIHADSATNAIERMATLTQRNLNTTDAYAYRQIAQHIDFVVQISKVTDVDGKMRRMITEISEIQPGEEARPIASPLFGIDPITRMQVPVGRPSEKTLALLAESGLNDDVFIPNREVA